MHDPWLDRLSDHIDGHLDAADEQSLRAHLSQCDECSRALEELRAVVTAAREAPTIEPARDLWPAIRAAMAQPDSAGTPAPAPAAARRTPARRFSFSMPQLAAAAVVLMALSGTAVWVATNGPDAPAATAGTIIQSAGSPGSVTPVAAPTERPDYGADVAELERALAENSAGLDPATVEVVQRSLESIDRAIEDARAALAADPGNPFLHRQLDNTMRRKIDVLRRATGVDRGRS
jgi:anti-sigma factor RsiW